MRNTIAEHRRKRGLTQAQLAQLVGKTRSSIAMYETSANDIPASVLCEIAKALNVPLGKLIVPNDEPVGAAR